MTDNLLTQHRAGFDFGYTPITTLDSSINMDFGILKLRKGEIYQRQEGDLETALVIMSGGGIVIVGGGDPDHYAVDRYSVFSELTTSFLLPKNTQYSIHATDDLELSVLRAKDDGSVLIIKYGHEVEDEQRGKDLMDNTCHRIVRAIFDDTTAPKSNIVVGEVINFPGRFSSYPDHAHPQEELYHYRFAPENGYGFAKHGEDEAFITKNNDTILIEGGNVHPQASAPGYRMYYLWAIRHLTGDRYGIPDTTPEHEWLLDPKAEIWSPE